MRQAQMSGARLPRVGYASYADCGQGVLHPTNKWRPGARLGNSALSIQFGKQARQLLDIVWAISPVVLKLYAISRALCAVRYLAPVLIDGGWWWGVGG